MPPAVPPPDPLASALAVLRPADVQPPSAAERIAGTLREEIVEGRVLPGTRLTEETIATGLGVSRNTVREALALLVSERIVVREPNRGVFVASPTTEDVRDLYATRLLIEPAAILWGSRFGEVSVAAVRAAVSRGQRARAEERWDDVGSANQQFHRAIVAMSGSRRLEQQMNSLLAEMRLLFHLRGQAATFHAAYLDINDEICGQLEAGDREGAAALLRDYLTRAQAQLLSTLDGP